MAGITMSEQKVIVIPEGKICDYIDGKFRNDTPEEYVRQTIEKRLVNEHKYLPGQIKIEYTLQVGSNKPRADIVIWDKNVPEQTQGTIRVIIECKKETVDARNAKDGIAQLQSYMSVCPNCEWGMWTNSIQKFVFRKCIDAAGNITFMEYNDIPSADGNLDDVNRPSRKSLRNASDDNLLFVFKTCHNHIYVNDGMQKQPAFFELLKVIFCKIEDERNIPKRRMKNTGQVPMYYAENTHPAIIEQELFDMAQAEMQHRLAEKDAAVGTSRYTSKYPFSGLLVCGTCGHRLRRHVRTVGSGKRVPAWGCANRISNGRAACDSHHINEDVLERTFRAAIDGMDIVIDAVQNACEEVLDTGSRAELERVQQEIITIQEAVLALHKDQQQGLISNEDYDQKVAAYSQQMDTLQERQRELKATAGRYAEVKYWLDAYKEHVQSGKKMDTDDAVMIRSLTDKIVVYDDRLEIHLRIGEIIEQPYK